MSRDVFLLLSKYLFVVRLKKLNKAVLTIVIGRKESDNDENIPRKYFSLKKNDLEICLGTGI